MNDLRELLAQQIVAGLRRKAVTTCSKWAEKYRITKEGPWSFKYFPWLKEMHDSKAEFNIGQKAAQLGFTEWAMNKTFFEIDVRCRDCLYILPTAGDASDFSAGRFDPALEYSPHVASMFSDVKNVGHKRAGNANLYVRGSLSRNKLKSIPTGFIVFDELEEMNQDNIPLALERASGQSEMQVLMISTPIVDGMGINAWYEKSTKERFFFPCPGCSRQIELTFPECLKITAEDFNDPRVNESYIHCPMCHKKLEHELKHEFLANGYFVSEHRERPMRGFTVNQLYSSKVAGRPWELAKHYLQSLTNPAMEQEFYNSKLGKTHMVGDAQVTDVHINACIGEFKRDCPVNMKRYRSMGVDVGSKRLHYEVDEWTIPSNPIPGLDIHQQSHCKVISAGFVNEFRDLHELMSKYCVHGVVIDRHPETRSAHAFALKYGRRAACCVYHTSNSGKQIHHSKDTEQMITVDRTAWMDLALGRFKNTTISIPVDMYMDYREQIKNPVRVYDTDANKNPVSRFITADGRDHHAHARTYAEIALQVALGCGVHQDITG